LGYRGGGGLLIRVYSREEGGINEEFLLDVGVRYIVGGELQDPKEGSIRRAIGQVIYDTLQSETDLLGFLIGMAFRC